MGDFELKAILFISPEHESALSVDLGSCPLTGCLVQDDKILVVGCDDGNLKILSLDKPDEPKVISTIKL